MRVRLVSTYPPANCGIAIYSERFSEALERHCTLAVLPVEENRANPFYFLKLGRSARKGTDIVHVQYDCSFFGTLAFSGFSLSGMYTPLFYLAVKLAGGPQVVTTVHEVQDAKKNYRGRLIYLPMHLYYAVIYKAMVWLSDIVIVHTAGTVETLSQYTRVPNAQILPLAIHARPAIMPDKVAKSLLGLAGKRVIVLFGFISPSKGHDLAIEAMPALPDDVVLYIAGSGRTQESIAYLEGLKEKVREKGLDNRIRK
jgi:glycosyltransferase involved in cell wall biosynthesis